MSTRPVHAPRPLAPSTSTATGVGQAYVRAAPMMPSAKKRSRQHDPLLELLGRKHSILEREPVALTAALDQVSGFGLFRQRELPLTVRTAHPVGQGREPAAPFIPEPEGMARAIRAVHEIARLHVQRQCDHLATIGAADDHAGQIPRSR